MTNQDTLYATRFSDNMSKNPAITTSGFTASGQTPFADYTPTQSAVNVGLMGDIGRAYITALESNANPFDFAYRPVLARGDSILDGRFKPVNSRTYDPLAGDSVLFNANRPEFVGSVATKNYSRQTDIEINDQLMSQYMQTAEMQGDVESALMASLNQSLNMDLYTASVEYFCGSTRGAQSTQLKTLADTVTSNPADLIEAIWTATQKEMGYVSTSFNKSAIPTKAEAPVVILSKDCEFPAFKKLYAETFNPDFLKLELNGGIRYVESMPTCAGAPSGTELVGVVADPRAFGITPLPNGVTVEAFRNPARRSTSFFQTAEFIYSHAPMYDVEYIFAPTA